MLSHSWARARIEQRSRATRRGTGRTLLIRKWNVEDFVTLCSSRSSFLLYVTRPTRYFSTRTESCLLFVRQKSRARLFEKLFQNKLLWAPSENKEKSCQTEGINQVYSRERERENTPYSRLVACNRQTFRAKEHRRRCTYSRQRRMGAHTDQQHAYEMRERGQNRANSLLKNIKGYAIAYKYDAIWQFDV